MRTITICDSGVANVASVRAAFERLGCTTVVSADPARLRDAPAVVLPGVGSFDAVDGLRERGLASALVDRAAAGRPLLGICLGLQLLTEGSEESPDRQGLGIIPGRCRSLPPEVRVPHLGWNDVEADEGCRVLASGVAAFANSYALTVAPGDWKVAWTTHGHRFVAGLERGAVVAMQFHPELSAGFGQQLLQRWLDAIAPSTPAGLRPRIIPCLDVKDGRVVKGVRFQGLRDAGDPAALGEAYAAQGADELVVLDIAASPRGAGTSLATVRAVRARLPIPLTVGGGVRVADDAGALLAAGADKVSMNTAAVRDPALVSAVAGRYGTQCTAVAIDARRNGSGGWTVLVSGGREATPWDAEDWAREVVRRGAGELLVTSWDRDGTREGYDLELLTAMRNAVDVPLIASGGGGTPGHLAAALTHGADAVLAASIFHDGDLTVAQLKGALRAEGVPVR